MKLDLRGWHSLHLILSLYCLLIEFLSITPLNTGILFQMFTMYQDILIVDDDEDIVELFKIFLVEHGYQVDTALTSEEALKKPRKINTPLL